jgi:hypothetical protein
LIESGNVHVTIPATLLTGLGTDTLVSGSLEEAFRQDDGRAE